MLSLNILEKSKKSDLNNTNSTRADSPLQQIEPDMEKKLINAKIEVEEEVYKILSGQYNNQLTEENEFGQGMPGMGSGMMRSGPGGPGGVPQDYIRPYQSRYEALKARLKILGLFVFHLGGILLLRGLSYRLTKSY